MGQRLGEIGRQRNAPACARRAPLISIAMLALAGTVAGCGVPADGPIPHASAATSAPAPVVPRIVDESKVHGEVTLLTGSSTLEAKIMRDLIARFEADHPKIKVRFTASSRDYPTVVLTRFAGGDAPDVLQVDGKFFSDWRSKGLLLPLDGYLQGERVDLQRYLPEMRAEMQDAAGRTFALPRHFTTVALFVNDELLRDAGVTKVPATWAELETASARITEHGDAAGLCMVPRWERLIMLALQQGGGLTNAAGTEMDVASAGTRTAITWTQRMLASGAATSPDKVGSSWCGEAFGKGDVAMALEGAWMSPPLKSQFPDRRYSVHPLPVGARPATLAYVDNMAISSATKHPDAAWMLLEYLAAPEAQRRLAQIGAGVPAMSGVPYPDRLEPFAAGLEHATVWSLPPGFFNTVLTTADNEMSAVLEGKQSVDGMLGKIDDIGVTMLEASK